MENFIIISLRFNIVYLLLILISVFVCKIQERKLRFYWRFLVYFSKFFSLFFYKYIKYFIFGKILTKFSPIFNILSTNWSGINDVTYKI